MKTPFLGGAYTSRSSNLAGMRCINLFPETALPGSRDTGVLFGTPGLSGWVMLADEIRGMRAIGALLYVVAGNTLYSVTTGGVSTSLGTIGTSTGHVSMSDNAIQLAIVDGSTGWILTLATGVLSQITAAGFPQGAKTIIFQNSCFLSEFPGTRNFAQSGLLDGTAWDAMAFGVKEGSSDNIVGVYSDHREVWVFGARTTEIWGSSGETPFSFALIQGAFLQKGLAAVNSVSRLDNSTFWLSSNDMGKGMVFRADGYSPTRVSTHAIEFAIAGYGDISDAIGMAYEQEGHAFYLLTFPSAGKTWCYDAATQTWHERAYLDGSTLTRHRANCMTEFDGHVVVGDFENGKLYRFDLNTVTDDGLPIKRIRSWGHLENNRGQIVFYSLELIHESGTVVDSGIDPQIVLRWSDDGGHNWSNEHQKSAGLIGETNHRTIWRQLGSSRHRIFELSTTDAYRPVWISAHINLPP